MSWIDTYVDDYYKWLREMTFIEKDSSTDWYLISTPFLGAFNDALDIYAQKSGDIIKLSDNGETFGNLELQGLQIQGSKRRKELIDSILLNYGVQNLNHELLVESNHDNFSQSKHNLLSAILEINDLYVLSSHNVASIFKEDVRAYLDNLDIVYTPDFISKGNTGLEFTFDFQIAKKQKEIVLKSFNTVQKSNLLPFLFSWDDIKPVREKTTKKNVHAVAIINDIDKEVKTEYLDALKAKNAHYILWSQKDLSTNIELLISP